VKGDREEVIASKASATVVAETCGESFHVLHDVGQGEHTAVHLYARRHTEVELGMT
jgi:hypothetical protein